MSLQNLMLPGGIFHYHPDTKALVNDQDVSNLAWHHWPLSIYEFKNSTSGSGRSAITVTNYTKFLTKSQAKFAEKTDGATGSSSVENGNTLSAVYSRLKRQLIKDELKNDLNSVKLTE